MKNNFRSGCPIATTLDIIGDKWSLLIIRDMLVHHKMTFKEFSVSDEQIAPSILSSRLKSLESYGMITKEKLESNKKENIYLLTDKTIELASVLVDISVWGDKHLRQFNDIDQIDGLDQDKAVIVNGVKDGYKAIVDKLRLNS